LAAKSITLDRSDHAQRARFEERHFTVAEIGATWRLSNDVIRRLFETEPGVLVIADNRTRSKRSYRTLRVPETVMERVHRRLSNP
jgi:hypothetical protein